MSAVGPSRIWLDHPSLGDLVIAFDFEGCTIRVLYEAGAPWFVAYDVCELFDLSGRPELRWLTWLDIRELRFAPDRGCEPGARLLLSSSSLDRLTTRCALNPSLTALSRRFTRWKAGCVEARLRAFHPDQVAIPKTSVDLLRTGGLLLSTLFELQVSHDPLVHALVERGSGHCFREAASGDADPLPCDGTHILRAEFLNGQPLWPVVLDEADLFVDWCDQDFGRFAHLDRAERRGKLSHLTEASFEGRRALSAARLAADVVRRRYVAMLRLLRSGELEAFGHSSSGSLEPIAQTVWKLPNIFVNFRDNEVHTLVLTRSCSLRDQGKLRGQEETRCLWFGIVLRQRTVMQPAPEAPEAAVEKTKSKNKGGRPPEYPWPETLELLTLSYGEHGAPASGTELYSRIARIAEYLGKPSDEINEDTIRIALDKVAPKLKAAALGTLQMKPLPKPEPKRKPQKLR